MFTEKAVTDRVNKIMKGPPTQAQNARIHKLLETMTSLSHAKAMMQQAFKDENLEEAALITIATTCLVRAEVENEGKKK